MIKDKDIPLPSRSLMEYIHLEVGCYFMRNVFKKISEQAKRNYTFQCIYLLLEMFAFIRCRLQRLAYNECLKNP